MLYAGLSANSFRRFCIWVCFSKGDWVEAGITVGMGIGGFTSLRIPRSFQKSLMNWLDWWIRLVTPGLNLRGVGRPSTRLGRWSSYAF